MQWRIQGGRPPPFGPRCRLFNIGPKVAPPLFLLVDLRWTPVADPGCVCDRGDHPAPLECGWRHTGNVQGGVLVNVQEWGCFSIFLRADDVTRTMSKGCVCLWMSKSGGVFQISWGRMTSRGQCPRGGVLVKNPVSAPGPPPPPFNNPGSALVV